MFLFIAFIVIYNFLQTLENSMNFRCFRKAGFSMPKIIDFKTQNSKQAKNKGFCCVSKSLTVFAKLSVLQP